MKKDSKVKNKESVKLKVLKTMNIFNSPINDIYFFPNKNFLINADGTYKIYNDKYMCIRTKKDIHYKNIKIIDNDSFICLKDNTKLMNINLKTGKATKIFEFPKKVLNLLYYENKYITLNEDYKINLWQAISNNEIQLLTTLILNVSEKPLDFIILLVPEKDELIVSINDMEIITYFYDLKSLKIINKIPDVFHEKIYKLNDDLYIFPFFKYSEADSYFNIYDFSKNEIVKKIENKFCSSMEILNIPERKILLVAGFEFSESAGSREFKNIYVLNYNFEQIFNLNNIHYRNILGIKLYQKKEKEYLILTYSEDGAVNVLSLI